MTATGGDRLSSKNRRASDDVDAYVGARIALRRAALGLSQTALAERLGVSFQQLQKYEAGTNRISASRLHRLAAATGASPADFFPPVSGRLESADDWMTGLVFLTATPEGRAVADGFPRIADPALRKSLARIVAALAA